MAFMVCAPYCSEDGSRLRILSVVNCFPHAFLRVLLCRWQRIAHSFTHEQLSRWFARCIAQPIAVHCSFFHSLTTFPTICVQYFSADGNASHFLPLIDRVYSLGTILLSAWHRIAYSSTCQQVSHHFALHIASRMAAHCSFFHLTKGFELIRTPYCSDGSEFLVLQLANGFHNGWRSATLVEYRIGWLNTSDCRRVSHQITRSTAS